MSEMKEQLLEKALDYAKEHYLTLGGLGAQLLLALLITASVVPHIVDAIALHPSDGPSETLADTRRLFTCVVVCIFAWLGILLLWCIKRALPRFKDEEIGILVAPQSESQLSTELRDLEERLIGEIRQKDLTSQISVKTAPRSHKVRCHEDAINMLRRSRGRVLIWGRFEKITHKGRESRGFSEVSFTCLVLPLEATKRAEILSDSLVGKKWAWDIDNSIERPVVAQNLGEVARYVIGLSLVAEHRYAQAEPILGVLRVEVNAKYNSARVPFPVRRFQETIKRAFIVSLVEGVRMAYQNELYAEHIFRLDSQVLDEWSRKLGTAIELDENVPGARLLLAVVAFLRNDIGTAHKHLRDECQKFPASRIACAFSQAFLATFAGEYLSARKLYRKAMADPGVTRPEFIQPILSFLEQAAFEYKDKPALVFVIGLLNDELHDSVRAHSAFQEFVVLADGHEPLKRWVQEAKIRIQRHTAHVESTDQVGSQLAGT